MKFLKRLYLRWRLRKSLRQVDKMIVGKIPMKTGRELLEELRHKYTK